MSRFPYPLTVLKRLPQKQLIRRLLDWGHFVESLANTPREKEYQLFTQAFTLIEDQRVKDNLNKIITHPSALVWKLQEQMSLLERVLDVRLHDWDFFVDDEKTEVIQKEKDTLIVILDRLRSVFNVGSILRTSEGMGVQEVAFVGHTPKPDTKKGHRAAMGSEHYLETREFDHWKGAMGFYQKAGYKILGLEATPDGTLLPRAQFLGKTAILVGNERFGLEPDCLNACDETLRIPMFGVKSSYNVGVATAIALYEFRRGACLKKCF